MNDACCCSVEVDEPAEVYLARVLTARREHRCLECGELIEPGEQYEQVTARWDGHWNTYKTCYLCLRIRNDLFPCGWYFGQMREDIRECLGIDYVDGEDFWEDDDDRP